MSCADDLAQLGFALTKSAESHSESTESLKSEKTRERGSRKSLNRTGIEKNRLMPSNEENSVAQSASPCFFSLCSMIQYLMKYLRGTSRVGRTVTAHTGLPDNSMPRQSHSFPSPPR
jgi:hypothetical protein